MLRDEALREAFERLEQERDHHARGRRFEALVQRLFEDRRFRVTSDPGAAHPRQTDLIARRGGEHFLIEVKWQRRLATSNDMDSHLGSR